LMKARPVPQFVTEIRAHPTASPSLTPGARAAAADGQPWQYAAAGPAEFGLQAPPQPIIAERFHFSEGIEVPANAAIPVARFSRQTFGGPVEVPEANHCAPAIDDGAEALEEIPSLSYLRPLGQLRESFILAVSHDGLWIVDQHVAHERVLFERMLKQRAQQ